ncbi:MAG: hypothetical protein PHR47_02840 [Candidatus Pacebacteria bacterium]|nr:hypothetical protein [Candidatus Paceibacterota bacterium]
MNENFKILNRETELLIEEHQRIETNLKYVNCQIEVYEDKIERLIIHWKVMNPDFINRHFLFLNRRIDDLQKDRKELIFLLGELDHRLKINEEKIWNIIDEIKTISVLI